MDIESISLIADLSNRFHDSTGVHGFTGSLWRTTTAFFGLRLHYNFFIMY